jgi:hypothetical protein
MICWGGMEILETLDELIDPGHTALWLWDFEKALFPTPLITTA